MAHFEMLPMVALSVTLLLFNSQAGSVESILRAESKTHLKRQRQSEGWTQSGHRLEDRANNCDKPP